MTIGDLIFRLLADGSTLTPSVVKEGEKAGEAGGKALSARMGSVLKKEGVRVIGAAFTATAAVLTKGALEMEDAIARIRSETGASAEEAEQIAKAANRIAGDQQRTLEEVSSVAIAVRKNLGATGEELDRLTDATVKFARVTGQDAVGAVEDMDDIVDAFGLSLEDVTKVQDQLLASSQKYGGSVVENQKALSAMAPQLRALNLDYNDGIELLNLFAASGLNAADGQKALNQAIQKLPPGETLDQFVARLASVTDDGERARLAIEVFGSKAGAKLANAIRPGITSLDAFGISAEEAAGTVDESVDALDSSLGGRLRKVLSQAKAALRGFGADLGPGITAAAGLASLASTLGIRLPLGPFKKLGAKLGGAIASGIGAAIVGQAGSGIVADGVADAVTGAGRSSKLTSATKGLGKLMGTTLGKAVGVAFALVAVVELVDTFFRVKNEMEAQAKEITAQTAEFVKTATLEQLQAAKNAVDQARPQTLVIESALNAVGGGLGSALLGNPNQELAAQQKLIDDAIAAFDTRKPELAHAAQEFGEAASTGVSTGFVANVGSITGAIKGAAGAVIAGAKSLGGQIPVAIAQGILTEQDEVPAALELLRNQIKTELTPAKEIARTIGILTSKELAKALKDNRPGVRAAAENLRSTAEERLATLIANGGKAGKAAGEKLKEGLQSKNPAVRAAAQRVKEIVDGKLDSIAPQAGNAGAAAGRAFAERLRVALRTGNFHVNVSTGFVLPGGGNALGGPVWAGRPFLVNERTPRSEVMVPSTSGYVLTHADAVHALQDAAGGGGTQYNIPVTVQGAVPVRTARDIATEVRRAGEMGIPPPARLSPQYARREATVR